MLYNTGYVCGLTTHDLPHLGNLKTIVASILEHKKTYKGRLLMNFTDLGLSVYNKAGSTNSEKVLAYNNRVIRHFILLLKKINLRPWTLDLRRASFYCDKIIKCNKQLPHLPVSDGVVLDKENDNFYLWRVGPGYPSKGCPGWHNECSTLNYYYTQNEFAHYGGYDLKQIHHKNETLLLQYLKNIKVTWHRTCPVLYKKQKMSKSLQNDIVPLNSNDQSYYDLLKKYLYAMKINETTNISQQSLKNHFYFKKQVKPTRKLRKILLKRDYMRLKGHYKAADDLRKKYFRGYSLEDIKYKTRIFKLKDYTANFIDNNSTRSVI